MEDSSEWNRKGATLSDKTARREYSLTQEEIVRAIRSGRLQYRVSSMHGNPWFRLLRREVESLIEAASGQSHLASRQAKTELDCIALELKRLKTRTAALEKRKAELAAGFAEAVAASTERTNKKKQPKQPARG